MRLRHVLILPVLLSLGGCYLGRRPVSGHSVIMWVQPMIAVVVEQSSPVQTGFSTELAVPVAGDEDMVFDARAGYMRQWWDGGHDDIFSVGAQMRRPLDRSVENGVWVGLEGAYHNWRVSGTELDDSKAVSHVFGVSGLVGRPISVGPDKSITLFGGAGALLFGDFKADGSVWDEGGPGWMLRAGVELGGLFQGN